MAYFVFLGVVKVCGPKIEVKTVKTPKLKVLRVKRFCFLKKKIYEIFSLGQLILDKPM